jgi:hypothetical protein
LGEKTIFTYKPFQNCENSQKNNNMVRSLQKPTITIFQIYKLLNFHLSTIIDIENNEWFPFEECVRKLTNINDNGMWTNMFLDNDDNFPKHSNHKYHQC